MNTSEQTSAQEVRAPEGLEPGSSAFALPTLNCVLSSEHQIDLSRLSEAQITRVNQIAATVSFSSTNSLMSFGTEPQRRLNAHLDQLLEGIRTSEVGAAGDLTLELATAIKTLNLPKIKLEFEEKDWVAVTFGRLPLVGKWFSALRYLQLSHLKIKTHLDTIERRAEGDLTKLNAMNDKLDRMVDATIDNIKELELYLAAAQIVVKRARVEFETRRTAAMQSRDVAEIAKVRDLAEQLNAFETRVVRMHIAHGESIVAVPGIRAGQTASRIEMSNIMDSILFDLPNLKRAILQVASLERTARAAKATKARRELSRQISTLGSQQLQEVYLKAKESQGAVEEDVALLAQSADRLLQTIEMGHRLDVDNARKREKAISDLSGIKRKFTDALIASGERFVNTSNG